MRRRRSPLAAVPALAGVVFVVGMVAAHGASRPSPTVAAANSSADAAADAPSTSEPAPPVSSPSAAPPARVVRTTNPARVVFHGPRTEKVIALTFDDGWSTQRCETILSILESRRVPATFFPNAIHVAESPAFWQKVSRLGFPIGNHTYDHKDLRQLSAHKLFWEIDHDRAVVEKVIGPRMIPVLRPPFGGVSADIVTAAQRAGFTTVLNWDTIADDSTRQSKATLVRRALRGKNGSVVLMHCGPAVTPSILGPIIDGYQARGFRFVTVPELLGLPGPTPRFAPPHRSDQ
jgi:peptidoglycan-N-acetylglucosamine deacetylase